MSNTVFLIVVIRCRLVCACIQIHIYIYTGCMPKYIFYDVYKFIEIISLSIDSEKKN